MANGIFYHEQMAAEFYLQNIIGNFGFYCRCSDRCDDRIYYCEFSLDKVSDGQSGEFFTV